jgi:hypothetical protein
MGNDRVRGLALLNIHRDIPINKDNVIQRFAKKNKTRSKRLII